jgi:Xaa-Pro aminopeptidase
MASAGLDALLFLLPRNFYYATGHSSWFLNLYGEPGYAAAIVPADAGRPPGALLSDVEVGPFATTAPAFAVLEAFPVWIAFGDVSPLDQGDAFAHLAAELNGQAGTRSGRVDLAQAVNQLGSLIRRMQLHKARIGLEREFASGPFLAQLQQAVGDCQFVDASPLMNRLRAIKSPREASLLRHGTVLAEAGIATALEQIRPGMTAGEIAWRYRAAVFAAAAHHPQPGDVLGARITLRVGPDVLHPRSSGSYAVQPGDLIFMDCGVEVAGYWADMGRCFVVGKVSPVQRQIYAALRAGFEAGVQAIEVGKSAADIFHQGMRAVHDGGLTSYVRGNVGHGVGLDRAPELPILSAEEDLLLMPGQVLSVEFPFYLHGIGAFQLEDTFHLTEAGVDCFNQLSRDMLEIG